jgi:hypothetical protein
MLLALLGAVGWSCTSYRWDEQRWPRRGSGLSVGQGVPPALGGACDWNAPVDLCSQSGLVCTPALIDGGFTCELPGELSACQADGGCAPGLACSLGICLQPCSTTADCVDPLTACAPFGDAGAQCLINACGEPWLPCDGSDAGEGGTCVPLGSDERGRERAACQQAGDVPLGDRCQFYREDGGPGFCAAGLMCMVDAAGDNRGICMPPCNPFERSGPACEGEAACVPTAIPLPPPQVSLLDFSALTGVCVQTCSPDAGQADAGVGCPPPTTCINGSLTAIPIDVCLP